MVPLLLFVFVFIPVAAFFVYWSDRPPAPQAPEVNPPYYLAELAGLIPENLQLSLAEHKGVFLGFSAPRMLPDGVNAPLFYKDDRHICTFGPTGSGKNSTAQTPALLFYGGSALVVDVKGQLCAITARVRASALGQRVFALNPFGTLGIPSATYNPLSHIDLDETRFEVDCRRMAEGLIDRQEGRHWELSAQGFVTLLVKCVVLYEQEKTLARLWELVNQSDEERIAFFERVKARKDRRVSIAANRYLSEADEVRDSVQTAVVQLEWLNDAPIQRLLSGGQNELAFRDLKRERQTVYIILPFDLLHTHGRFLRLIVQSALIELMREHTQPEHRVLFMVDEFAHLGKMSLITEGANIVREFGITIWAILQNLPQLYRIYGEHETHAFLSAMGIIQVFTTNDPTTAEYFSKRSGVHEVVKTSQSFNRSVSTGGEGGSESASTTTGYQTETEALYKPEDFGGMAALNQILLAAGVPFGILACRAPYWEHPTAFSYADGVKLWEPDPYHTGVAEFERKARAGEWVIGPLQALLPSPQAAPSPPFTSATEPSPYPVIITEQAAQPYTVSPSPGNAGGASARQRRRGKSR